MKVVARDQGLPQLSSVESNVIVNVSRNNVPPVFIRQPYFNSLPEDSAEGILVYTVQAVDNDDKFPFNDVTYSIIGDDSATFIFNISSTDGEIRLTRSILFETETSYRVNYLLFC